MTRYEPSLGRATRSGTWEELSRGTFEAAVERAGAGDIDGAVRLLEVSVLEAEELHDIYERWPEMTAAWIRGHGVPEAELQEATERLGALIGGRAMRGIGAEWPDFLAAVDRGIAACRASAPDAAETVEAARRVWQGIHDRAVDRVAGMVDLATRTVGESALGDLWSHLMDDWYDIHERRYSLANQPWETSAHQLMVAIVDGFHAHLTGSDRQGGIEVIHETDRVGFRFAPCGSGGRALDPGITGDQPRSGAPFHFAVTTEPHDWAWNKVGICSYCVHCCLLNEVVPIDRIGFPTRVIDPPTWPQSLADARCTWWVYKDPSLVPDAVYRRVGRDPAVRPQSPKEEQNG